MTVFKLYQDSKDQNSLIPPLSDMTFNAKIPPNTCVGLSIPQMGGKIQYSLAIIASTNNYYVSTQPFSLPMSPDFVSAGFPLQLNTPAVPLKNSSASEDIEELYFLSESGCDITVCLYQNYIIQGA